jgi:hypothetical protein
VAESTLTLKRDDLLKAVGNMLGRGIDITNWEDADFTTRVNMCVDIGCRWVYEPDMLPDELQVHIWSFMQPKLFSFPLNSTYSNGTITIVAGVVTAAVTVPATVFPSWAADAELVVNGVSYPVSIRGSNTSLTLTDTTVTAAAGTRYTLQQVDYVLPELFGGFRGDLFLNRTSNSLGYVLERASKEELLSYQKSGVADFASQPVKFAIFAGDQTGAADQRSMLTVWPLPDSVYTISGYYVINPYRLTSALPYPMGGLPLSECLREAVMGAAEIEFFGEARIHTQMFQRKLQSAVSFDRQMSNPGILGQNLDRSYERDQFMKNGPRVLHVGLGPMTYTG